MTSVHHMPPELEKSPTRRSGKGWHPATQVLVFSITMAVGLLGATLACRAAQPAPGEPATKAEQELPPGVVEIDLYEVKGPPPKIKAKHVKRGTVVQFNSRSNTVWVMIPSKYFSQAGGGSDWAVGNEMIAFKIDHTVAMVKLSEEFPASDKEEYVDYSILFFDGEAYYYQEGGESPPRMIIPPI
jgi:hypothetical protein